MSDPRIQGPLSAIAVPLGDELAQHAASPPFEKNMARASFGAGLLTACGYAAATLGPVVHNYPPYYPLVWVGLVGFGLLLLVVGVRGARGPRDIMAAFWPAATLAGGGWALWHFFGPEIFDDFYVRGGSLTLLVSGLVRIWLALRGTGGGASKLVRQQIEQDRVEWRSTRRR